MKALTISALIGAGSLLAACTPQENLHPDFGNSVRHNMSVHIINPAPSYGTGQQVPELDGPRAADGQKRYDTGEVIQPERLRTTNED